MTIIRDPQQSGDQPHPFMLPLLIQWKIRRCNLVKCHRPATTIVTGLAPFAFGMCEAHYKEAMAVENYKFTIETD